MEGLRLIYGLLGSTPLPQGSQWLILSGVRIGPAKDPTTNGDFIVQGWKADTETERECLQAGGIPDTEAVVRLPARLVAAIREACDVADGPAVR
ncbi:hypothetical protein ACPCIU_12110 [Streptomyces seoulensis]|uniref:hypothetical protein n=1 Tax=Streptomyces seoulensis TaxID=73044 RepID=UPI003C2B5ED1